MCTFRNPHLIKEYDKIYNNLIGYVSNSALQKEKYLNKEKNQTGTFLPIWSFLNYIHYIIINKL